MTVPIPRPRCGWCAHHARRSTTLFTISVVVLAAVTLAAAFAPFVAPYDPDAVDFLAFNGGPTAARWLGTDGLGRDILSRMIWGARTALLGPLLVVLFSTIVGILLGLLAGWRGGWIDAVLSRVFDVIFAFPALLIAIMAVALFREGPRRSGDRDEPRVRALCGQAHPLARHRGTKPPIRVRVPRAGASAERGSRCAGCCPT